MPALIELGRTQLALEGFVFLVDLRDVSLQMLHQRKMLKYIQLDEMIGQRQLFYVQNLVNGCKYQ
jgi:hypothetical protein